METIKMWAIVALVAIWLWLCVSWNGVCPIKHNQTYRYKMKKGQKFFKKKGLKNAFSPWNRCIDMNSSHHYFT